MNKNIKIKMKSLKINLNYLVQVLKSKFIFSLISQPQHKIFKGFFVV